jgi:prepilin-type N-terminal cleavage/methylation domain-containing protein
MTKAFSGARRGFTLIELLVVIAIIGILSAVVLASLNTARSKGNDASIKSNLDGIRAQAAIYYDNTNNSYSSTTPPSAINTQAACAVAGTVFTDTTVAAQIAGADKASGGTGGATPTNAKCSNDGGGTVTIKNWAIYTPTTNNTSPNSGWCVDSAGASKADTVPVTTPNCP